MVGRKRGRSRVADARHMDAEALAALVRRQSGVLSRRQALALGAEQHDIRRWVRRREYAVILPGCLVDHTGPVTWLQRAWAAVLVCEPAALGLESALVAATESGRRDGHPGPIKVVVDVDRVVRAAPGVEITRRRDLSRRVLWQAAPPRLRPEEAALDCAARAADELSAVAVLAEACGNRLTTAVRLAAALDARSQLRRGRWLRRVIADLEQGTHSVLEHAYLTRVERPHGLPRGHRQARDQSESGTVFRDVAYDKLLVVELDGRAFHDSLTQRDRDLVRDLELAGTGGLTVRLGYGQVLNRSCATAAGVAAVLRQRGWPGRPTRCGPTCAIPLD